MLQTSIKQNTTNRISKVVDTDENKPTKIHKIGVDDRFGESGDSEELLDLVGLTIESIETAAKSLLQFSRFSPQDWV